MGRRSQSLALIAVLGVGLLAADALADVMYLEYDSSSGTDAKGYFVRSDGTVSGNTDAYSWYAMTGQKDGKTTVLVLPFLLPDLGNAVFTSADFLTSPYGKINSPNASIDLYGLSRATDAIEVLAGDYYDGDADPDDALIQESYLHPTSSAYYGAWLRTNDDGDAALVDWLNAVYDGGANAGKYVYLRLSVDTTTVPDGESLAGYYTIMTANTPGGTAPPVTITYTAETAVPEPASMATVLLGGVAALVRRRRVR